MPDPVIPVRDAYQRYLPWRKSVEIGFGPFIILFNFVANSITVWQDRHRSGLDIAVWEVMVWEGSSALLWLAILPAIAWFTRRFPFHWDNWRRQLPWHLLASVVVSLVHVLGMVGLRILAYRAQGDSYDFGSWPVELTYEYLKDVRTYALIVVTMEFYRLAIRRMRGEASLLDVSDEGATIESRERPERFLVRKLGREFLVAADDIEWLQASGNYVNLHVRDRDYPLRSTMNAIQEQLDPARFARIHRSHIVNLDRIASIEPLDTGDARVHMKDDVTLPCSRRCREELRAKVGAGAG